MKIKKYDGYLSEMKLTIPELNKEESRWNMFLFKLKNNSNFVLHDGTEVTITNSEEIITNITNDKGKLDIDKVISFLKPHNRYAPVIKTNNGDYKLNQFHKTAEFGGGAGASLGTVNARTYETIQALFFSLRQYLGRDIVPGDLYLLYTETSETSDLDRNYQDTKEKIYQYVKSTKKIHRNDLKFFEDKGWIYTYIKTANEFYKTLNQNKHYTFYHAYQGTGIADTVYKAFRRCIKNINKENKVRISMPRWNPSDIWAVETHMENDIIQVLNEVKNIVELNIVMDSFFDSNYFVGISLKKIPIDREIELIISKKLHTNFTYDFTSTSKGPFDTLTVQIHSKSYSWLGHRRPEIIDARIYSGKENANMFLEVKGSASKYGKASLTFINSILRRVKIEPIPVWQDINLTEEELKLEIVKLYKTIPHLQKWVHTGGENISDIRSKLVSKYQALLLIKKLEKYKKRPLKSGLFNRIKFMFNRQLNLTNYIIKEFFYYAYSMGGELFDNTEFYRIRTH